MVPRFESAPLHYFPFFSFKGTNLSQPELYSSGDSHFLYLPSGKHPRCWPFAEYHLQLLQVLPELRLSEPRINISSGVYPSSLRPSLSATNSDDFLRL